MLLAEALAARKDTLKEIDGLRDRIAASAVRYEDQETPVESPAELVDKLAERLDAFESLSVRIESSVCGLRSTSRISRLAAASPPAGITDARQ